ncbi:carboxyl transferase domain-containing protein [Comamonas sp.]|uniref:carboxyl transferase domain-containing protein n=1 Tax=Comamonas sp. TaxID=34028 RepID=UPI003A95469C
MHDGSFTSASVTDRLAALFDAGSENMLSADSGLRLIAAKIGSRQVLAAATDPALDKGVLGTAECTDLRRIVRLALETKRPLVLLIDSAGARLDEGLAIQGALRGLMTELLDASLAGLPMIALLGRNVFGGASMLAFAASKRCYAPGTLLAMSGPRVLESAGGGSLTTVRTSIGGLSRCRHGDAECLLDDTLPAYAAALHQWVKRLPTRPLPDTLDHERHLLGMRLGKTNPPATAYIVSSPETGSLSVSGRASIGAADALKFATMVDATQAPMDLYIDCVGHSLHMADETLILSQYLVHLARTLRRHAHRGQQLRLRIAGEISGGIYIATAGAASSVDIAPGGSVRTLPQASLNSILTRPDAAISNASADFAHYVELGVADTVSALS